MNNFIDEMLAEIEKAEQERKFQADTINCDRALGTIAVLQQRIQEANELADSEIGLIEEFRTKEVDKLNRQISWLSSQLELFIRTSGQSTISLPRGVLRLRMGRAKVEVADWEMFVTEGKKLGLVRVRQNEEPDLSAIHDYIRRVGSPPAGILLTPAARRFTFQTLTKGPTDDSERKSPQAGDNGKPSAAEAHS